MDGEKSLECNFIKRFKEYTIQKVRSIKIPRIHLLFKRKNFKNLQFGHDHPIFSLMRLAITTDEKEANRHP